MSPSEAQSKVNVNGSQPSTDSNSDRKRGSRKVNTLPSSNGKATTGSYPYQISEAMWLDLPVGAIFSTNPEGSFPLIKWTRSAYRDVRTLEPTTNVQGNSKVYRISI